MRPILGHNRPPPLRASSSSPFSDRIRVDDPVGAFSVHGVKDAWGTPAAGVFNAGGTSARIIGVRLLGTGACSAWASGTAHLVFGPSTR